MVKGKWSQYFLRNGLKLQRNIFFFDFLDFLKHPASTLVFETFLKSGKYSENQISTEKIHLLMVEKFKTNQIVFFFPGGYMIHLKPPFMCHMSHVLCLVTHAI